jgi:hypothetical protein
MNAIHDRLAAAVPPAPPSRVDVDLLIARGQRGARLRTAALTVGTAGLVTAAVALSTVVSPSSGRSARPADEPTSGQASPTGYAASSDVTHADGSWASEFPRIAAHDVPAAVRAVLSRIAPEVQVAHAERNDALDECSSLQGSPLPGRSEPPACTAANYVTYGISHGAQHGILLVSVHPDDGSGLTTCSADTPGGALAGCTESTVGVVRLVDYANDTWYNGHPVHHYSAIWPGGLVVEVRAFGTWLDSGHTSYVEPPLTPAQARELALDPSLTQFDHSRPEGVGP